MKKRFNLSCRAVVVFIVTAILVCVFPIWGIVWLITGWNYQLWMNRFIDPEWAADIDKINKKTEVMKREAAKWGADIKQMKKELAEYEN